MTFWEVIAVIFLNPFILSEFVWIFIRIFTSPGNLQWDNVDRINYVAKKDE